MAAETNKQINRSNAEMTRQCHREIIYDKEKHLPTSIKQSRTKPVKRLHR
jgi:hypothetical protein